MTCFAAVAQQQPSLIMCSDWSSDSRKRRAWLVDPAERVLRRLPQTDLTLSFLAAEAERHEGFRLIGIDAPIGVPASYLVAARSAFGVPPDASFLDWLPVALEHTEFLIPLRRARDWSPQRPFFNVRGVPGGRTDLEAAIRAHSVEPRRSVEEDTGGTSVFMLGIPSSAGAAALALWTELVAARGELNVAVWPFAGDLDKLSAGPRTVLAEIYPAAAYGTALAKTLPAPRRRVRKGVGHERVEVLRELERMGWLHEFGVLIAEGDRDYALADDGDFDALLTAAALLRLTLEGNNLFTCRVDPVAEGAMLCG
jgi:hypothetical protein